MSTDGEKGEKAVRWPYVAERPQRYSSNYARYLSLGGSVELDEFVAGFVHGGANQNDIARFYFFSLIFDQLTKERLEGDLAELGVYKGHTATLLAKMARKLGKTAYILDTFSGFHQNDLIGVDSSVKTSQFADTSLDEVRTLVGEDNVKYIKGYFPETACDLPANGRYCVVHIDCDLYLPITNALEYFYPRLVPGGFLVIHDYSSLHWSGAEKAVDEFFSDKPESIMPVTDSAGSAVIRRVRRPGTDNWMMQKRAELLQNGWVAAGSNRLCALLGAGWSVPEPWGVWGAGEAHELKLVLPGNLRGEIELQADVHAALVGVRQRQTVEVLISGDKLSEWIFATDDNRRIRSVKIPLPDRSNSDFQAFQELRLTFRPADFAAPADLDPALLDIRPLGVALHAINCVFSSSKSDATRP